MSAAASAAGEIRALLARRRRSALIAVAALAAGAMLLLVLSLGVGAVPIPPERVVRALAVWVAGAPDAATARDALVVVNIRLPRLILGFLIGGALALAGALMQGLFRNPLADPGLVGVSAGAGLAAAIVIVLGDRILLLIYGAGGRPPFALLPLGAFFGGLLTTTILYLIATRQGRTSVATMLLAGVALGALAGAGTGLLAYLSDDRQLRDLTFWSLGSLGGASWLKVSIIAPILMPLFLAAPFLARGLNGLALGEAEAFHLGMNVQRLKAIVILLTALAVGASVAAAGVIGFVGIVVPHLIRLLVGPDHRLLLPLAALIGGSLLVGADLIARIVVNPAEMPIGIVTAAMGAPFFLWLLLRRNARIDL